ncbi:MAG TPA: hypothetical protein PK453_26005 [Leptospiraceae bacterium]|nr:hypothetical protein [Leptospiraceae bacterium]HNF27748.1 hypothetical protein [Leptospiraceae bacterium]HNI95209.1 hypothetical protein [Leptospiraceae bacterium]HNM05562.1 hypothetical protein [Leptospiraceae bacterium]
MSPFDNIFSEHYDKAEMALEKTRELYNQGMPISDLLRKIDDERFFTPNRKGPFELAKEDLLSMSDWDKDSIWRVRCFFFFFMECFHVSLRVSKPIMALWEVMKHKNVRRIEHLNNMISGIIEEERLEWEEGWYKKRNLQDINLNDYYDKADMAIEKTRELYKQGMPISDLLRMIDKERFFTPNKKERYKLLKEDFYRMSDRDKDREWRLECFGYFLMECFHIAPEVHNLVMALRWANTKINNVFYIDYYNSSISELVEEERSKWDKEYST